MSQLQNVPFFSISASPMSGIYASLRQAQILIFDPPKADLWLKFLLFLISEKIEYFETGSDKRRKYEFEI